MEGFCSPPIETSPTPAADLLGELGIGVVVYLGQGKGIGGGGQEQYGRVGGVDLAVGRWRGQIARQLPARGINRRLDVIGRRIDIAIQVELHHHGRDAEAAGRRRLCHARDLRELALQGLGDRRRHRLRAGSGKLGRDLDGGEVDPRQRRHGEHLIRDQPDEQDADHDQRRADRVLDERS